MRKVKKQHPQHGIPVICLLTGFLFLLLSTEVVSQPLTHEEQVELLAEADTYYASPNRISDISIMKYQQVLNNTNFVESIQRDIHRRIGNLMLYSGNFNQGSVFSLNDVVSQYEKILNLFPDHLGAVTEAYYALGDAYRMSDNVSEAETYYLKVLAQTQDIDEVTAAQNLDEITTIKLTSELRRYRQNALRMLARLKTDSKMDRVVTYRQIRDAYGNDPELFSTVWEIAEKDIEKNETSSIRFLEELIETLKEIQQQDIYGEHPEIFTMVWEDAQRDIEINEAYLKELREKITEDKKEIDRIQLELQKQTPEQPEEISGIDESRRSYAPLSRYTYLPWLPISIVYRDQYQSTDSPFYV